MPTQPLDAVQEQDDRVQARVDPLGSRTSRAVVWMALGRYTNWLLNLGIGAILARLLIPKEFGIVAMATVFSDFMAICSDAGLRSAVVQYRDLDRRGLSSIFWMSLPLSGVCAVILIIVSFYVARFTRLPILHPIISVLSLQLPLSALSSVNGGLLQRQMRFKELSFCNITAGLLAGIVALTLAWSGAGCWALVAQSLLTALLTTLLVTIIVRWFPSFSFDRKVVRRVFSYSGNMLLSNAMYYWARNLDSLLIGYCLGSTALGYYNRAYTLMLYPVSMLHGILSPVLHPALASLQSNIPRMYKAYLRIMKFIAMISLPMMIVLGLDAASLIRALWGPQWEASISLFRILCIVGAIQPMHAASGTVFLARNRTDMYLKTGSVYVLFVCTGILLGLHWRVNGVAIGYTVAYTCVYFPIMYITIVCFLNGDFRDFLQSMKVPVQTALAVSVVMLAWNLVARDRLSAPLHLIVSLGLSLTTFLVLVYRLDKGFVRELFGLLPAGLRGRIHLRPLRQFTS